MTIPLKDREIRCLEFLKNWNGEVLPSLREIAHGLGFRSAANVHHIVKGLEAAGYIKRIPGRHRSIEVIPQGKVIVLSPETHNLADRYATARGVSVDYAVNDLLRGVLTSKEVG